MLCRILAKTLAVVVDSRVNPASHRVLQALLVPERNASHVIDKLVQFERVHLELRHRQFHVLSGLVGLLIQLSVELE